MILAVVITNASKTGRTDVLGRTDYFIIFIWAPAWYRVVLLMAHNREVVSSIPAVSSNKFEKVKIMRCWLNLTM
jgi:hypothetical protein